jgi:hypothetical protein
MDEFFKHEFIKSYEDRVVVEGTGADYIWYNARLLTQKMSSWAMDFEKVVSVMEARHKEHIKMLQDVMDENAQLKKQLKEKE